MKSEDELPRSSQLSESNFVRFNESSVKPIDHFHSKLLDLERKQTKLKSTLINYKHRNSIVQLNELEIRFANQRDAHVRHEDRVSSLHKVVPVLSSKLRDESVRQAIIDKNTITRLQQPTKTKTMNIDKWLEAQKRAHPRSAVTILGNKDVEQTRKRAAKAKRENNEQLKEHTETSTLADGVSEIARTLIYTDQGQRKITEPVEIQPRVRTKKMINNLVGWKVLRKEYEEKQVALGRIHLQNEFNNVVQRVDQFLNELDAFTNINHDDRGSHRHEPIKLYYY